jgi:hypothetical protein
MEFRAYIVESKLRGLQQKDETAHYPQIEDLKKRIFARSSELAKTVSAELGFHRFILDIYIDIAPRHKAWAQDVTPLCKVFLKDSNLYSLEEIIESEIQDVEFRTLDKDSALRPQKHTENRFPIEINNPTDL